MEPEELIPAKDFCIHHNIEYSFVDTLQSSGLIGIITVHQSSYLLPDEVHKLEKFVRLHYDLDINIEGIETINYLLEKIENMQKEMANLKNRIGL